MTTETLNKPSTSNRAGSITLGAKQLAWAKENGFEDIEPRIRALRVAYQQSNNDRYDNYGKDKLESILARVQAALARKS